MRTVIENISENTADEEKKIYYETKTEYGW